MTWHTIITESDRARLHDWHEAFSSALAVARKAGYGISIDREGALLDPDAETLGALPPPPGEYLCRVIKIGAQTGAAGTSVAQYTVYPNFRCEIAAEGDVMSFAKLNGVQRPVGLLFKDTQSREIFLGTMMLGDETLALQYGRDSTRDMVGVLDSVQKGRWRLSLPHPHFESVMDVIELVPNNH